MRLVKDLLLKLKSNHTKKIAAARIGAILLINFAIYLSIVVFQNCADSGGSSPVNQSKTASAVTEPAPSCKLVFYDTKTGINGSNIDANVGDSVGMYITWSNVAANASQNWAAATATYNCTIGTPGTFDPSDLATNYQLPPDPATVSNSCTVTVTNSGGSNTCSGSVIVHTPAPTCTVVWSDTTKSTSGSNLTVSKSDNVGLTISFMNLSGSNGAQASYSCTLGGSGNFTPAQFANPYVLPPIPAVSSNSCTVTVTNSGGSNICSGALTVQ